MFVKHEYSILVIIFYQDKQLVSLIVSLGILLWLVTNFNHSQNYMEGELQ